MRIITDVLDSVTNSIRAVVALFMLLAFLFGLVTFVGAAHIVPAATDKAVAGAERATQRAIDAQRERDRERVLAKEGWGFDSDDAYSSSQDDMGGSERRRGDWGSES